LGDWKRYTARALGIDWQRDFFDHRIRGEADGADQWSYIRENPVRAGLVERYHQWQHVWFPHRIGWPEDEAGT
jgi:putative transposase